MIVALDRCETLSGNRGNHPLETNRPDDAGPRMLCDARYLTEEFVPREVVHREGEVDHLAGVLGPLQHGGHADTVLITGPTGTGKTCIAQYTVDQLCEERSDLESVYVNCWEDHSRFQVLFRILDGVERTVNIYRRSTPRDVLLERLRDHDGPSCVVVLDEVDQIEDRGLLYELTRLQGFPLVLIANRQDELLAGVDERLASRLRGGEHIRFDRYSTAEIVDILRERADRALTSGSIGRSHLEEIANVSGGDARVAITTLRTAARKAQRSRMDRISSELIENALPDARNEIRQKNLDSLTEHQRAVYDAIEEFERIAPGDLYHEYRNRVENPKSDRTIRNYLSKMEQYNLVSSTGTTQDRIYRCVDAQ